MLRNKIARIALLTALAALLVFSGSVLAAGDGLLPSEETSEDIYYVSDVDELLAALGSNRTIYLAPGEYDLSAAENYGLPGDDPYAPWWWEWVFDGYELVLANADNLTIAAEGGGETAITTESAYANVLDLRYSRGVTLSGLTLGHSAQPGSCTGDVVCLTDMDAVNIMDCDLYGCGVVGIRAYDSRNLFITGTTVRECSDGAVDLTGCYDVRMVECSIVDCGYSGYYPAFALVRVDRSCGVAVLDSEILRNNAANLLTAYGSPEVYMLDTLVEDNICPADWGQLVLFDSYEYPVTVAGCQLQSDAEYWLTDSCTVDAEGQYLTEAQLRSMQREFVYYEGPSTASPLEWEYEDGIGYITVTNTDELLSAIRSDAVIRLAPGEYDLTLASNYGAFGGAFYRWEEDYDGYHLVISGAENLWLTAEDPETTLICTEPRYADVIEFSGCRNIFLSGIALGHTQEPGECVGAVLHFRNSEGIHVTDCALFGCGTLGLSAEECTNIDLSGNEIYGCSLGAIDLFATCDARFNENDIHDCAWPTYELYLCKEIVIDGEFLAESELEFEPGWGSRIITDIMESGAGIYHLSLDISGAGPYWRYDEYPDAVG